MLPDLIDREDVINGKIIEGQWHYGTGWLNSNALSGKPAQEAINVRNTFCEYFQ